MANNSFTYCDSDEEVFFGKTTEKELRKMALLGIPIASPACSTPRPQTAYVESQLASNLPVVLDSSSKNLGKTDEPPVSNVENKQSSLPNTSIEDDDVILIENDNTADDSVQIISDDDSFLINRDSFTDVDSFIRNEELCKSNTIEGSVSKIDQSVYAQTLPAEVGELNNSSFSDKENTKSELNTVVDHGSFHSQNGHPMTNISKNVDLEKIRAESVIENLELQKSISTDHRTCSKSDASLYSDARQTEISELDYGSFFSDKETTNSEMVTADESIHPTNESKEKNIIENVDRINSSSGSSNESTTYESTSNECQVVEVKDIERLNISSSQIPEVRAIEEFIARNSPKCENSNLSTNNDSASGHFNNSSNVFHEHNIQGEQATPIVDYQSTIVKTPIHHHQINNPVAQRSGLSDLDYSSLYTVSDSILNISHGSSLPSPPSQHEEPKDPAELVGITYEDVSHDGDHSLNVEGKHVYDRPRTIEEDNEDFHMSVDDPDLLHNSSLGNAGTSGNSSYATAFDATSKQSSNQFTKYRDRFNDTQSVDINNEADLEKSEENKNETSFEMVMQNRQNSFDAESPIKSENISGKNRTSKLPVFKSTTSLIKPPLLNVKPENLLPSSYKWAKHLPNSDVNNKPNQLKSNFTSKLPCVNTGNKALLKVPTDSKTPNKKHLANVSAQSKTPNTVKTSAQVPPISQRIVKSDSKAMKFLRPPVQTAFSHENRLMKSPGFLEPTGRDKYKNIISPVRLYITGAPVTLQEKAQLPREGISSTKKKFTHIPTRSTPLKENENTQKKASKVVQKLNYAQAEGQENVAPDCCRDTLPPRVLEEATAVFMKEDNKPKRVLPKIGETMQKLLKDIPRPKITVHQGRVTETPRAKGQLIPNKNATAMDVADISVRVVRTPEDQ